MDKAKYHSVQKLARDLHPRLWLGSVQILSQFTFSVLAIGLLVHDGAIFKAVGAILTFAMMWRWFSILHTAVHGAIFPNRIANEVTGLIASAFCLLPYYVWKKSHLGHHQWTGWNGRDPSLSFPTVDSAPDSLKRAMDFAWRFHLPFFSLYFIVGKFWGSPVETNLNSSALLRALTKTEKSLSYGVLIGVHGLLVAVFGWSYCLGMVLPTLLYLITSDIVLLNQHSEFHTQTEDLKKAPKPLHPIEHLLHTRSVLLPEFLSKHVLLRFDRHELHHLYPSVPHYSLEALRPMAGPLPNEVSLTHWMKSAQSVQGHMLALANRARVDR